VQHAAVGLLNSLTSCQVLVSLSRYSRPISLAYWRHWVLTLSVLLSDDQLVKGLPHNIACLREEADRLLQIADSLLVAPQLVARLV